MKRIRESERFCFYPAYPAYLVRICLSLRLYYLLSYDNVDETLRDDDDFDDLTPVRKALYLFVRERSRAQLIFRRLRRRFDHLFCGVCRGRKLDPEFG